VRPLIVLLIAGAVLSVVGTGLVADSPSEPNVASERNPSVPERPAILNDTTAASYLVDSERTRLYNDLLRSRGYTLDRGDDVLADCTTVSSNRTRTARFRVRLRCHDAIEDTYRLI
jgi:hypothetical protein